MKFKKGITIGGSIFFAILIISLLCLIALSPYGENDDYDYKIVKVSVPIDAQPSEVFTYLGNSKNAKNWSVFVDHISPLNPNEKDDGEIGSLRRCFNKEDESGLTWDEEILNVEENKYRLLRCYNLQGFKMSADNIRTEQLYEELEDKSTLLSFTLFFTPGKASFIDELKMYYSAYKVTSIFQENLNNIKYLVENNR